MHVELRDEARDDLVNAALFYGNQSPGLEDHFLDCLRDDLKQLETTAGIHEKYRGFHRKLSRRFPFAVYYQMTESYVDVLAILDCRERPDATDTRLGRTKP
jgi:plasmid stabilization system protein ParE